MAVSNLPGFKYLARNNSYGYLVISIVIFVIGSAIAVINWHSMETRSTNSLVAKYQQELNQSKQIITQSLAQYSLLLDDGASLLSVDGNNVTQEQWQAFFQSYNLPQLYPGVDAVSFSQYVTNDNLQTYLNNQSAQGNNNFTITPAGTRNVYAPVTYIGYVSPTSLKALGYDQLSSPIRSSAILAARDSGQISMTGKLSLVAVNKGETAFLIYKPIYNGPANTVSQRQSSIYGFVFEAVNANDFLNALLYRYESPNVAIQIFDNTPTSNNLLYETPNYAQTVSKIKHPVSALVTTNFGGRNWALRVVSASSLIQTGANQSSLIYLVIGILLSALIAGLLWYFAYHRERKSYWQKQKEIQDAKDELLSLASHQLRTPATIVKQYLGILLQNYAGKVTPQQRKIIKMAYDSNERQLEIANQFLDAAKLGSGRIKLNKEQIVMNDVIDKVVAEQQQLAKERRQKIIFTNPKKRYSIKGDPKYLPMVFENLINNAIKYSKQRTKITVKLRRAGLELQVIIKDEGIGIPETELPLVFEKFSHSLNSQDVDASGTGIGLYLANQIAKMHRGGISVKSTVGKGSEFIVHLPIKFGS